MKRGFKAAGLLFFGGMLLLHAFALWKAREVIVGGYPDFTAFYAAGKIVHDGSGSQLYDDAIQWKVQQQFAAGVSTRQGPLPYIHPPFEALLFVPFTLVSYPTAYVAWTVLNAGIAVGVILLLRPYLVSLEQLPLWLRILSPFAFTPVFVALLQGQDSLLLLLFYSLTFVALKKDAEFHAGCWLGLGVFKPHLVVPLVLVWLLRGRMRAVCGFLSVAASLALVSLAVVGWQGLLRYPGYIWWLEQRPAFGLVQPRNTPNLRGLMEGILSGWMSPHLILALVGMLSFAVIWLAARRWRRGGVLTDLAFSYGMVVVILASYHVFIYDLSILLLPILLLLNELFSDGKVEVRRRPALIGPLALLLCGPIYPLLWFQFHALNLLAIVFIWWMWGLGGEMSRRSLAAAGKEVAVL